jgi:acyl transferase domain-containing protein/NADP-dependent 3-hydroxy acid dehydrogenase YdfG/acyl carrier protein
MSEDLADRRLARNPIAIVGMSGLFPMARSHREYWQNIVDGTDCTQDVPDSRWKLDDYYDPDPDAPDKTYSRRGAFLPDVDFDPLEFGLPPNQLGVTTTMQMLSLGVARDLLLDAGASESDWYDPSRTGVVLGATGPIPLMHPLAARLSTPVLKEVVRSCGLSREDADEIADKYVKAFAPWQENSFPGLLANVIAGRVANRLGLGGMNCTVDAACAASMSAIRLAVAELVDGRAEMMITGGVDTESSIFMYMCFSKVGALSHSGQISPFSNTADGTLLGEGIGMVALKRLSDAVRDGNRIYAVIRGIGSSSDGRGTSIYAPRAEGQRLALDRAYADAECSPASVELFEAHATGTVVGDRTELSALGDLLRSSSSERHFAALGSVKSQIGHTKGAAGTASLMKLAFALHHKVLPGTINVDEPNSSIDFANAPFYVNVKTRPWILDPHRPTRRAGVSAMGFGGTNFHLVLEEYQADRTTVRALHRTAMAHLWHAPNPARLLDLLRSGQPSGDGGNIPTEHARIGFVATDDETAATLRELAIQQLADAQDVPEWSHPKGVFFRQRTASAVRVGALFAGQGSQYVDMGLEVALSNPVVGGAFDAANAFFSGADTRLAQVVFPPPMFDPELRQRQESTLRRTEYAQPAIGALSVGQFRYLTELGLSCSAYAGHSFGELTALWAAGSVSDSDYFHLAVARGQAMAPVTDGDAGAMAAVQATREQVAKILSEFPDVVICNHNAPDQVVVGGGTENVKRVVQACSQQEIRARLLPVSAAFHTRHVAHAVDAFRSEVEGVRIGPPLAPVHANSPGASYGADADANAHTLVQQLLEPVEFVAALRKMRAAGVTVFVEFGPKQVLTQFVRQTFGDEVQAIATDAGPLGDSEAALKRAAVQLAVLGVPLSGINHYTEPAAETVAAKGMTVSLSGSEYVPDERRAAYQAALESGYRVEPTPERSEPALAGSTPTPSRASVVTGPALPAPVKGSLGTGGPSFVKDPVVKDPVVKDPVVKDPFVKDPVLNVENSMHSAVDQHLALHSQYLESQLRVAEQLASALSRPTDPHLSAAVVAVAQQSSAIAGAHARASEILAVLAELESGLPGNAIAINGRSLSPATSPAVEIPLPPRNAQTPTPAPQPPPPPAMSNGAVTNGAVTNGAVTNGTVTNGELTNGAVTYGAVREHLRAVLVEVIAQKTGYPPNMIDPTMDLEMDLGVDSIKRIQVLGAVQERMPGTPTVGPEQLSELRTVDQIAAYLADGGDANPNMSLATSPTVEIPRPRSSDETAAPASGSATTDSGLPALVSVSSEPAQPGPHAFQSMLTLKPAPALQPLPTPAMTNGAVREHLRAVLVEVIAQKTGYPPNMIDPTMDLEMDLGVDSIKRIQVLGAVQERVPGTPTVGPEQLSELRTVDQIAAYLADGGDVRPKVHDAGASAPRHTVELAGLPAVDVIEQPYPTNPIAVLFDDRHADGDALAVGLATQGWTVRRARPHENIDEPFTGRVDLCITLIDPEDDWAAAQRHLTQTIMVAKRATVALDPTNGRAGFVTITRLDGGLGFYGRRGAVGSVVGGVSGVVKTLAAEQPGLFCRAIDVEPALSRAEFASVVLEEIRDAALDTLEVGVDASGMRRTVVPSQYGQARGTSTVKAEQTVDRLTLTRQDVLLVTGGARGVTARCVRALAAQTPARFLLLGRTELDTEPAWASGVADTDLKQAAIAELSSNGTRATPRDVTRVHGKLLAQREIRDTLAALGGRGEYLAVDITDPASVQAGLAERRGQITGLVHGAGVLADAKLADKTVAQVETVFKPKLDGLRNVLDSVDSPMLRHLVLFTSVAGLLGNPGQADYAAANEALCRFAAGWRHTHPTSHVTAIDWGAWNGGMVTAELRELFTARGIPLLDPQVGARAFVEQFTEPHASDLRVLIGASAALGGRRLTSTRGFVAHRNIEGIVADPVIQAHRIGAHPVLPATFGLGWLVNVVERAHPGLVVVHATDFQVHKGIVFDERQRGNYLVEVDDSTRDGDRLVVRAVVRSQTGAGGRVPHYAGTFVLALAPQKAPVIEVPPIGDGPDDALEIYHEATQFHGPRLQGMRMVLHRSPSRLVVLCRLADADTGGGAYAGRLHSPVLADVLLQGPPVLGKERLGGACLPLGIGRADWFAPLPDGEPFILVIDDVHQAAGTVRVTATAAGLDGRVLHRFADVTVVSTKDMTDKFRESVRSWRQADHLQGAIA